MEIKPIKTDDDNQAALKEIDRLFDASPDTPEGDRLEVLVALVITYENIRYPMKAEYTLRARTFCERLVWHWPGKHRWNYKGERRAVCRVCCMLVTKPANSRRWILIE